MFEFNATFVIAVISFVVFIIIMNAILYKPVLSVIKERQSYIDKNRNDAQNSRNKAQKILNDKDESLNAATLQARQIISARLLKENDTAKSLTENAKKDAARHIQNEKEKLSNEEIQIKNELKSNIKELAETISSKILGEQIAIEDGLINKVLK